MEKITKEEFLENEEKYLSEMKAGKIFIYPTDTIYGIGCDALNSESVFKVREIKKRDGRPFSVIVPGKDWIKENCFLSQRVGSWLEKLPGAYTFILELRNWEAVSPKVNEGGDNLGVRIPDNWFAGVVEKLGRPFVTTSVNLSGEKSANEIREIDEKIIEKVDYVIDDGILSGSGSKIVKLINGKEEILRS